MPKIFVKVCLREHMVNCCPQSNIVTVTQSICPKIVEEFSYFLLALCGFNFPMSLNKGHCLAVDTKVWQWLFIKCTHSVSVRPDQTKTIIGWRVLPLLGAMHPKFLYSFEDTSAQWGSWLYNIWCQWILTSKPWVCNSGWREAKK